MQCTIGNSKQLPKDASVVQSMLKDLGVSEYEPAVVNQILDFSYRYVVSILEEAKVYSNHAGKNFIDIDDIKLALMMHADKLFSAPPPRDLMMEIARMKNSIPLPMLKENKGIRLPPDRYCLVNPNRKFTGGERKDSDSKSNFSKIQSADSKSNSLIQRTGTIFRQSSNSQSSSSMLFNSSAKPIR